MKITPINTGIIMIHIDGRFDSMISDVFMNKVKTFISKGINKIIVNLDQVDFIDSKGIASIIISYRWLDKCNGDLMICNVHEPAASLIKLTRLDRIIKIIENDDKLNEIHVLA